MLLCLLHYSLNFVEKNKSMVFTQNIDEHVCWDVNLKQRKLITSDSLVRIALIFITQLHEKKLSTLVQGFNQKSYASQSSFTMQKN